MDPGRRESVVGKVEAKLREVQDKRMKIKEKREQKKQTEKVDLVGMFGDPAKFMKRH